MTIFESYINEFNNFTDRLKDGSKQLSQNDVDTLINVYKLDKGCIEHSLKCWKSTLETRKSIVPDNAGTYPWWPSAKDRDALIKEAEDAVAYYNNLEKFITEHWPTN